MILFCHVVIFKTWSQMTWSDGSCFARKRRCFTGVCTLDLFFSLLVYFAAYGSLPAHTKEQRGNGPEAVISSTHDKKWGHVNQLVCPDVTHLQSPFVNFWQSLRSIIILSWIMHILHWFRLGCRFKNLVGLATAYSHVCFQRNLKNEAKRWSQEITVNTVKTEKKKKKKPLKVHLNKFNEQL